MGNVKMHTSRDTVGFNLLQRILNSKTKTIGHLPGHKLNFNGMPEGELDIDHLMASLRMEYRALIVSAGAIVVQAIMQAECEQLAGKPYARKTEIGR